jgi:hypothetical protein
MGSATIALIALVCIFGAALLGQFIRVLMPEHHLKDDTLSVVKLATGLIGTMAALALGMLISSAKGTFDHISSELVESGARVVSIDRLLAEYGPETAELRATLKSTFAQRVEILTSGSDAEIAKLDTPQEKHAAEVLRMGLTQLPAKDDRQRGLRARAVELATELAATRTLVILQKDGSIPMPLLSVLIAWLALIFAGFGICAPRNHTTMSALLVASICASGAIFLILEMDRPLSGLIRIPAAPLQAAVAHLGL